jgi:acyl-CoA thioesterase II
MGDFERDTRVTGSGGSHRATLSEDWNIWGPNGGYLAAIALRAVGREAQVPRPASFHAHFLSVARFAEVEIEVTPVRLGRRSESFRASMRQDGKPVLEALVRTAAEGPGLAHDVACFPDVPRPEGLANVAEILEQHGIDRGPRYAFWQNLESRPCDPERVVEGPSKARPPLWREWYRFRPRETFDDPWVDAGRYLLLVDTLSWPAACQPHPDSGFTAPSLDVAVWFHRAVPDEPWLLADHVSPLGEGGLLGTTGQIWSRDGRLVASGGSQLFCIPLRPADAPG